MASMFEDLKAGVGEGDAFLAGERRGYKVTVRAEIDVKSIRKGLHMTQAKFSDAFGFSLDAVKHWEGGRRTPEASARLPQGDCQESRSGNCCPSCHKDPPSSK
jgi:putative transcriptional regulator